MAVFPIGFHFSNGLSVDCGLFSERLAVISKLVPSRNELRSSHWRGPSRPRVSIMEDCIFVVRFSRGSVDEFGTHDRSLLRRGLCRSIIDYGLSETRPSGLEIE